MRQRKTGQNFFQASFPVRRLAMAYRLRSSAKKNFEEKKGKLKYTNFY